MRSSKQRGTSRIIETSEAESRSKSAISEPGLCGAQVGLLIHCRVGQVLQDRIVDQLRDFRLLQHQLNIRGHAGLQVAGLEPLLTQLIASPLSLARWLSMALTANTVSRDWKVKV